MIFGSPVRALLGSAVLLLGTTAFAAEAKLDELVTAATTGEEGARLKAIDQIGALGENGGGAVEALEKLLGDNSAQVRAHVASTLGKIGAAAKPTVPTLVSLLKDESEVVRRQTVKAIAAIRPGPKVMIPLFIKLMEDPDAAIRVRILNAVAEAGPAAVPGLIEGLKHEKAGYWALLVLREMGPAGKDAVPTIAELLKDTRPEIRREAALTLGAMREAAEPVLPQIAALLDDEHARIAATFALGQIGKIPEAAETKVRAQVKSEDKMLATVSMWALAKVHPENKQLRAGVTVRLIDRLQDDDAFVRVAAARALAELPPAPEITVPIWEKALESADETKVHHALDALAALGAPAVPRLIDALKHEKLQAQIVFILGEIGAPAAPAAEKLGELVGSKNERVATEAAIALAKIGPSAKLAAPALCQALKQKDEVANLHAVVYALGKIGPSAAACKADLVANLAHKDQALAVASAWALVQVEPDSPALVGQVLPVLTAGLGNGQAHLRSAAADAIGGLGAAGKPALAALEKAAKDENADVARAAAAALKAVQAASEK